MNRKECLVLLLFLNAPQPTTHERNVVACLHAACRSKRLDSTPNPGDKETQCDEHDLVVSLTLSKYFVKLSKFNWLYRSLALQSDLTRFHAISFSKIHV